MKNFKVKTKVLVLFMTLALIFSSMAPSVYAEEVNPQDLPTIRYEDNNKAIQFVGSWVNNINSSSSGGSGKYSNTAGDYMRFDFIGTGIKIIGYNGNNKGFAKITIDDEEEVYDFYTSNGSPKALLYTKSGLKFGKHSLRIDVLAQNRIWSNNSYVYIDAIDVLNADNKAINSNNNKYIVSASNIAYSIHVNDDCILPRTVNVKLSDGSSKSVKVAWEKTNFDTSRSGTINILGKVKNYDKKVTLTLNILENHSSDTKYYTKIASSRSHTLAIKDDGTVWAWGNNDHGQLGNSTSKNESIPIQVNGLNDITAVAAHENYSLALKKDGTVWEWGNDNCTPAQIKELSDVVSISSGYDHSLALKSDGTVWAWGKNSSFGELGDGTYIDRDRPVQVKRIKDITSISAGREYSLAVDKYGQVWDWGFKSTPYSTSSIPCNVLIGNKGEGALSDVIKIAAGNWFGMALKKDGTVWVWGDNQAGELGDGTSTSREYPVQLKGISNIVDISVSGNTEINSSLALQSDGTVWAWGNNSGGQLGDGTRNASNHPVKVNNLTDAKTIFGGGFTCYAVKKNGTTVSWGSNGYGLLGNMNFKVDNAHKIMTNDVDFLCNGGKLDHYKYAVKKDGTVWNIYDSLSQMQGVNGITSMSGTLALKNDGSVWNCNPYYKINVLEDSKDDIALIHNEKAQRIENIDNVKSISGKYALKEDGTVWCFNIDRYGMPLKSSNYIPKQVDKLKDIVSLYTNGDYALAVDKNGDVWSWKTDSDKLDSDKNYIIDPVKINDITNVDYIDMYDFKSIAVKKDGTVWSWENDHIKPVKMENADNVQNIYYYDTIYIVKKDGTVWEQTDSRYPYVDQIKELSDITQIVQPYWNKNYALKKDGTVWCFGYKYYGKVDNGDQFCPFTPYQDKVFKDISYINPYYVIDKNGTLTKLDNNKEEVSKDESIEFKLIPSATEKCENVKQVLADDYDGKILNILKNDGTLYDFKGENNMNITGSSSTPVEVYCK